MRNLSEGIPNGWPAVLDDEARMEVAMALASWVGFTPETHQERASKAAAALRATPPRLGWRPFGPDDKLLHTLLRDEQS